MDSKNYNKNQDDKYISYKKYDSHPINIKYFNVLATEAYIQYVKLNSFCVFKSVDDINYLIYTTKKISIIFYNLIDNKKISEIKNAHSKYITSFRHYFDDNNKRDLILSISLECNLIKLWNVNNLACLLILNNINNGGVLL